MYSVFFDRLGIKLSLTAFECEVLRFLNVVPSQLHPNSWPFVRAFEIACDGLHVEPSLGVFFSFYQVKSLEP
ncbi:hypothetical protein A2U01_0069389, partial [Trifolium medium]|nr:hypothetical protein [Trifolium medium]